MRATPAGAGWGAYRVDEPEFGEPPRLAFYCLACADRELGRRTPRRLGEAGLTSPAETYDYELWDGSVVVATGRLQHDTVLNAGARLRIGGAEAVVRHVLPETSHEPARLVLRLVNA